MERNNDGGSGKPPPPPPAKSKPAWRDGAVTYFHLLFYIAISGGQIFFNKASPKHSLPPQIPARALSLSLSLPRTASLRLALDSPARRPRKRVGFLGGFA